MPNDGSTKTRNYAQECSEKTEIQQGREAEQIGTWNVVLRGSSTAGSKESKAHLSETRINGREERWVSFPSLKRIMERRARADSRCSMSAENCLMASSEAAAIAGDGRCEMRRRGRLAGLWM